MIKRDEAGIYQGLACDTCGAMAPPPADIIAGHGLIRLGWHCSGGTHICPACPHPAVADRRPVPLARTVTA